MAQFIDLSHTIPANMQYASYSKARRSQVVPWHNILETTIQESKLLMFSDHVATHVEAPSHFNPDGKTIDQMPVDLVFERPAVWVDLSHKQQRDSITPADLEAKLPATGWQPGDIVILYTGASRLWESPKRYWRYRVPLTPEAVHWLLDRGTMVIGVDEDEIDRDHQLWPAHMVMRQREFYIIENLALWPAVVDLPPRFTFYGVPYAIKGATASPIRALAAVNGG